MGETQQLASVLTFASQAEHFCALVESHSITSRDVFLQRIHLLLAPLYAAALALPAVELGSGAEDEEEDDESDSCETAPAARLACDHHIAVRVDEKRTRLASVRAVIGDADYYAEVFDAYELPLPSEPVVGSLADDIVDIWADLSDGLCHWVVGDSTTALWKWRFGFTVHWGEHLTSALRALHVRASSYDGGFPAPSAV